MNLFKKLFFVASLSLYVFTAPSFADNKQIYVDNHLISLKEEIIVGDSVLVPLRDVCENLGYNVSWYGPSRLIHLKKNFHDILIDLKNEKVFVVPVWCIGNWENRICNIYWGNVGNAGH